MGFSHCRFYAVPITTRNLVTGFVMEDKFVFFGAEDDDFLDCRTSNKCAAMNLQKTNRRGESQPLFKSSLDVETCAVGEDDVAVISIRLNGLDFQPWDKPAHRTVF